MKVSNVLVVGLSGLALALASIALLRQEHGTQAPVEDRQLNAADLADPEVARLRDELIALRRMVAARDENSAPHRMTEFETRLAALELRLQQTPEPGAQNYPEAPIELLDDEQLESLMGAERLDRLTRRSLARLQQRKNRAIVARWVHPGRDGIDGVLRIATERLALDARREGQVRRIALDANDAQREHLDRLDSDPPPGDEDRNMIMGEMKHVWLTRNEQLAEVLTPDELLTFHEIEASEAKTSAAEEPAE